MIRSLTNCIWVLPNVNDQNTLSVLLLHGRMLQNLISIKGIICRTISIPSVIKDNTFMCPIFTILCAIIRAIGYVLYDGFPINKLIQ